MKKCFFAIMFLRCVLLFADDYYINPKLGIGFRIDNIPRSTGMSPASASARYDIIYSIRNSQETLVYTKSVNNTFENTQELFITETSVMAIRIPEFIWTGEYNDDNYKKSMQESGKKYVPDGTYTLTIEMDRDTAREEKNEQLTKYTIIVDTAPPNFTLVPIEEWDNSPARLYDKHGVSLYSTGEFAQKWDVYVDDKLIFPDVAGSRESPLPVIRFARDTYTGSHTIKVVATDVMDNVSFKIYELNINQSSASERDFRIQAYFAQIMKDSISKIYLNDAEIREGVIQTAVDFSTVPYNDFSTSLHFETWLSESDKKEYIVPLRLDQYRIQWEYYPYSFEDGIYQINLFSAYNTSAETKNFTLETTFTIGDPSAKQRQRLAEHERLESEWKNIVAERELITTDQRLLAADQDKLVADQRLLAADQDRLVADQRQLAADQDKLVTDQRQLVADQDRLATDQDIAEAKGVPKKKRYASMIRHWWRYNKQITPKREAVVPVIKEETTQEPEHTTAAEQVSREREGQLYVIGGLVFFTSE
jgi:hypothetical protein